MLFTGALLLSIQVLLLAYDVPDFAFQNDVPTGHGRNQKMYTTLKCTKRHLRVWMLFSVAEGRTTTLKVYKHQFGGVAIKVCKLNQVMIYDI